MNVICGFSVLWRTDISGQGQKQEELWGKTVSGTEDGTFEIKKMIGFYTQLGAFILRLQDFVLYIYKYYIVSTYGITKIMSFDLKLVIENIIDKKMFSY